MDTIKKKKFFLVMRTLRICSLNKLSIYRTSLLAIGTMLYIISLVLKCEE